MYKCTYATWRLLRGDRDECWFGQKGLIKYGQLIFGCLFASFIPDRLYRFFILQNPVYARLSDRYSCFYIEKRDNPSLLYPPCQ